MNKGLRRVAAVAVAALVVAPALATAASANSTFTFDRLQGSDRNATAVEVAKVFGNSTNVILANGTRKHVVDALTAAYLAGVKKAPVLLTGLNTTPPNVEAQITASGATDVWIVGGEGAISAAQATALDVKFGTIHRLGGLDRYLTAQAIIGEGKTAKSPVAIVTTGVNFPDALGAGPLSYANGHAIGITGTKTLPAPTLKALQDAGVKSAIVLGGPTVVTPAVVAALTAGGIVPFVGAGVTDGRIFGANRSETSAKLAEYELLNGFTNTGANVASGQASLDGADALGGASLSGKELRPTLITESITNPGGVIAYLTAHAATLAKGHIFGGTGAVSTAAQTAMETAAKTATSNQTYTVTQGDTTVTPVTGSRTYTVSGLTVGDKVQINLVDPTLVDGGVFTLNTDQRTANLSPASVPAGIDQINGVAASGTNAAFTAVATTFTFRVKGAAATSVVPVVFNNNDADGTLEVNLAGVAKEAAGIGGMVTFTDAAATVPAEAANGNTVVATATVTALWSTGFVVSTSGSATGKLLAYHANDVYQFAGATKSKTESLSILSVGDTIAAITDYSQAGSNTYNILTDMVSPSSALTVSAAASTTTLGSVKVTYNTGVNASPNGTVFTLQRRQVSAANTPVVGTAGVFATVKSGTVAELGAQTFTETLAAGSYEYQLLEVSPDFTGTATVTSALSNVVPVTTTSSLAVPSLRRLYLTSNASDINNLSKGDVFKVVVTTPLATPVVNVATLNFNVGSGTSVISYKAATSTDLGAATFAVNAAAEVVDGVSLPAGTVLTVTMINNPTAAVPFGTTTLLNGSAGIGNTAGTLVGVGGTNAQLLRDVVI